MNTSQGWNIKSDFEHIAERITPQRKTKVKMETTGYVRCHAEGGGGMERERDRWRSFIARQHTQSAKKGEGK
jgi:hypothetical protein